MNARPFALVATLCLAAVACGPGPRSSLDCDETATFDNAAFPDDAALGAFLDSVVDAGLPGAGMLVHDPSRGTWAGTRGLADLATRTPLKTCHRFPVGSITKTFTASLVLQLVEQGRLGLDDPLTQTLPPDVWRGVANAEETTIRQALTHTSGIANFTETAGFTTRLLNDPGRAFTPVEMVRFAAGEPAVAPAGATLSYSNTNYELLGLVVERAYGRPLGEVMAERLFQPLGLSHTALATRSQPTPPGTVSVYTDLHGEGTRLDATSWRGLELAGSGGAESTLTELEAWLEHLLGGDVLNASTLARMREWHQLNPEEQARWNGNTGATNVFDGYGLGLVHSQAFGLVGHSGGTVSAQARLYRFEASGRTLVLFTNASVKLPAPAFNDLFDAAVRGGVLH